jgi:NADH-quinone oxidoreductase subunit M
MVYAILILIPLVAATLIAFLDKNDKFAIRTIATIAVLIELSTIIYLLSTYFSGNLPVVEIEWLKLLHSAIYFKPDGLGLSLMLLTAFLALLSTIGSFAFKIENEKLYHALLLILYAALFGVFSARDFLLFYVFWEATLIPMYFLIGIFGSENRRYAAIKFFIYTFLASVLMLVGILIVAGVSPSLRFEDLVASALRLRYETKVLAYVLIFIGFAVKLPVFPFHTWLPDAHVQAPTAASVLLAGILLKMGGYGFFELLGPMFPGLTDVFGPYLLVLAAASVIYGALTAFAQTDVKKLIAYSSVAHMGFVTGSFAAYLQPGSRAAAAFVMWAHGLITGMLFYLVGLAYERFHSREMDQVKHLTIRYPELGWAFVFAALASLGLPGLAGFVGEFMAGAVLFSRYGFLSLLVVSGVFLNATYLLKLLRRSVLTPVEPGEPRPEWAGNLLLVERLVIWLFIAGIVVSGVLPSLIIKITGKA